MGCYQGFHSNHNPKDAAYLTAIGVLIVFVARSDICSDNSRLAMGAALKHESRSSKVVFERAVAHCESIALDQGSGYLSTLSRTHQ